MTHRNADTRSSALKAIARAVWKLLSLVFRAFCRVAGSFLAVAVAALLLFPQLLPQISGFFNYTTSSEITDTVIYEQLNAISELAVYEYRYKNHVDCTNVPQLLGHDVWATDHWFAFDYSGIIKVGFDFDRISVLLVDPNTRTVFIHMPDPAVLSNEISIDLDTYEDRNNVCNPLQPREVLEYLYARRDPEQKKAIDAGILDMAAQNAQDIIALAIRSLGYEAVFR